MQAPLRDRRVNIGVEFTHPGLLAIGGANQSTHRLPWPPSRAYATACKLTEREMPT